MMNETDNKGSKRDDDDSGGSIMGGGENDVVRMITLIENGCPVIPHDDVDSPSIIVKILVPTIFTIMLPIVMVVCILKRKWKFSDLAYTYKIVNTATSSSSCTNTTEESSSGSSGSSSGWNWKQNNQDPVLLSKLWKLPSAKPYVEQNALEYQRREGYCSLATLRCVLHSFPSFPKTVLPKQTHGQSGPSNPEMWQSKIDDLVSEAAAAAASSSSNNNNDNNELKDWNIQTRIVGGAGNMLKDDEESFTYELFLETLRNSLNNNNSNENSSSQNERIAINYLRPVLFGFKRPKWVPFHLLIGLVGGHFSPVIGLIEQQHNDDDDDKNSKSSSSKTYNKNNDNPLVGVFDVNHTYGGAYLVPAKLLYESVKAKDITTGKSRALIVVKLERKEQNKGKR